ncbi:MAG: sulfite exporter TauE/SafE family protein, partial [Acidobacteria bacterium]|nr:sulfite exporter TauE/SafE family protein [Acidobacteriota bacterium]
MPLLLIPIIMAAGAVAGCLGAVLGIGGGVFLIPLLNVGLGLDLPIASGISLMTVIATSST